MGRFPTPVCVFEQRFVLKLATSYRALGNSMQCELFMGTHCFALWVNELLFLITLRQRTKNELVCYFLKKAGCFGMNLQSLSLTGQIYGY